MDTSRHKGRVAIVTGAGSGIGRATAIRLAQEGAQVVGCDVNAAGLDETRAALEHVEKGGGGSIVTVASEASLRAGASGVAYTASKHAVIGLVKSVAFFYGPKNIRANAVLPGPVVTAIAASSSPEVQWAMERAMKSMATMPQPAEPDRIAATISWLASDEASFVNGAQVTADGGWSTA